MQYFVITLIIVANNIYYLLLIGNNIENEEPPINRSQSSIFRAVNPDDLAGFHLKSVNNVFPEKFIMKARQMHIYGKQLDEEDESNDGVLWYKDCMQGAMINAIILQNPTVVSDPDATCDWTKVIATMKTNGYITTKKEDKLMFVLQNRWVKVKVS
jgi:hypothetical protein